MLNFSLKGTYQDSDGYLWDYYKDDQLDPNPDPNAFYIIPKPQFVIQSGQNTPIFNITENHTDDSNNGSGTCQFQVELSVPQSIENQISAAILANPTKFPGVTKPSFLSLMWNKGGSAGFNLITNGVSTFFSSPVSQFGSNTSSFLLSLTKDQLSTIKTAFSGTSGGAITIVYNLSVPARLQGVNAVLEFDSSIAYQYQVTQPTYNSWGDQTSSGSVQKLLTESEASTIKLTWGIANPPQELVTSVTNWANKTIADLVNGEVQKVIGLQGLSSGNSFNINEVNSFTSTYQENMVVNWIIQPQSVLQTFPEMNLNVNSFCRVVEEVQQVMTITTNLPFANTPKEYLQSVPTVQTGGGVLEPALVDNVTINVSYPTLTQANSSYTFKSNGSNTFTCAFDQSHGSDWTLEYTVNYVNQAMPPVTGTVNNSGVNNYNITVEAAGILSVNFDATNAFNTGTNVPKEIDVNFSFVPTAKNIGETPFNYTLKLTKTNMVGQITSLFPVPITSGYNYQVNYIYEVGVPFPAPLIQNQTGFNQTILQAAGDHAVKLIVYMPAIDVNQGGQIFDANVSMWYDTPPNLPSGYPVQSLPTQSNPTTFNISPVSDKGGNLYASQTFYGLVTSNEPLYYSATIDSTSGQIIVQNQMINNTIPSIMVTLTQQYYTLEIDPVAIDWAHDQYDQVQVLITFNVAQGTAPNANGVGVKQQQIVQWNKGETGNQFLTLSIQQGNIVTYDCETLYVQKGQKTQLLSLKGLTEVVYNIAPTPTN
jgi:hypothetical protein